MQYCTQFFQPSVATNAHCCTSSTQQFQWCPHNALYPFVQYCVQNIACNVASCSQPRALQVTDGPVTTQNLLFPLVSSFHRILLLTKVLEKNLKTVFKFYTTSASERFVASAIEQQLTRNLGTHKLQ